MEGVNLSRPQAAGPRSLQPSITQGVLSEFLPRLTHASTSVPLSPGRVWVKVSRRTFARFSRPHGVHGQPSLVNNSHATIQTPVRPMLLVEVDHVRSSRILRMEISPSADSTQALAALLTTAGDLEYSPLVKSSRSITQPITFTTACSLPRPTLPVPMLIARARLQVPHAQARLTQAPRLITCISAALCTIACPARWSSQRASTRLPPPT